MELTRPEPSMTFVETNFHRLVFGWKEGARTTDGNISFLVDPREDYAFRQGWSSCQYPHKVPQQPRGTLWNKCRREAMTSKSSTVTNFQRFGSHDGWWRDVNDGSKGSPEQFSRDMRQHETEVILPIPTPTLTPIRVPVVQFPRSIPTHQRLVFPLQLWPRYDIL